MCALRQPLWPASDKAGDELGRVVPRARTQPSDCCHDYTLAAATNARRGGAGTGAFEKVVGRGGGSRIALRSPDRNSPTSGWLLGRCRAARGPLRSPSGVGGPRVLRGCVRCGTDANARPRDGAPVIKLSGQAPRQFLASSAAAHRLRFPSGFGCVRRSHQSHRRRLPTDAIRSARPIGRVCANAWLSPLSPRYVTSEASRRRLGPPPSPPKVCATVG